MKRLMIPAAVVSIACWASGCTMTLPGIRWEPTEQQRQSAQAGADLAGIAATAGLPPATAASRQLAAAARASASYAGPPSQPLDISDLVPPAIANAWNNLKAQTAAWKLKEAVQARAAESASGLMARVLDDVKGKAQIGVDRVVHRLAALAEYLRLAEDLAAQVPVPPDAAVSAAEQERLDRLDATLKKIAAAADAQANRRPTMGDVADKAMEAADSTLDKIAGFLEAYWPAALAIPGVGGLVYGARKRRQQKDAAAEAADAQQTATDAQSQAEAAQREAELIRKAVAEQTDKVLAIALGTPAQGAATSSAPAAPPPAQPPATV
jgi:hypothetical protein